MPNQLSVQLPGVHDPKQLEALLAYLRAHEIDILQGNNDFDVLRPLLQWSTYVSYFMTGPPRV